MAGGLAGLAGQVAQTLTTSGDQTRRLASLRAGIDSVTEQVSTQVTEMLAALETQSRRSQDDTVAHMSELSEAQQTLGTVLGGLERRAAQTLALLGDQRSEEAERLGDVTRQLEELREQLASVGAGVASSVAPVFTALQERHKESADADQRLERKLTELEARLSEVAPLRPSPGRPRA